MKKVLLSILVYIFTLIPTFGFSEIDNVASIEASAKGEYQKIDKTFHVAGVKVLEKLEFSEEEKDLIDTIYQNFEEERYFEALENISKLSDTEERTILRAFVYAALDMTNTAEDMLKTIDDEKLDAYKKSLYRENMYEITPYFGILTQDLDIVYDLDYEKWGLVNTKRVKDAEVRFDYSMINYTSSNKNFDPEIVNTISLKVDAIPDVKFRYRGAIAARFYERDAHPLLLGDINGRYYFNDWVNIRAGLTRDRVEQSYITAVGDYINNEFTGRAASNKVFVEANFRMKYDYYASIRGIAGFINGYNLPENFYYSGYANVGKRLYNNPHNPYIQKVDFDFTTYCLSYQKNLLTLYGADGQEFGGYFSPRFYNATTANIRLEGIYKR